MKKLTILLALPLVFLAEGCSKFTEGYDKDPNNPTEATPALVLASTELGFYSNQTSNLARISVILTQQCAGGLPSQMVNIDDYIFTEASNTNEWNNLYNSVVQPANDLIENYGADNQNYVAVAKILKAAAIGVATDFWGDVPASEAGYGNITGNMTPKFDTQEDVIAYVQSTLDEAIAIINNADAVNVATMGNDDLIFKGNMTKWKNVAYILKARYANRLSKKDASGSATKALEYLQNVTDAGDAFATYGTPTAEQNQWYVFNNTRQDYIKMGKFFVDMLNTNNDPRLPFYATKLTDGTYKGGAPGAQDQSASNVGSYLAAITAPFPLITYTEALFIKAEASLRAGDAATAATAYNAAVTRSVTTVTGAAPSAAFTLAYASATAATITQEMIMTQKYIADFGQPEVWSDWRRTNIPALTVNPNAAAGVTGIPRRLPTVIDERLYNPNAIVVGNINTPVWWDAQ